MSDKFNGGKYLFAISGNDFPLHIRLTVDNKPKQFDQMLGQYSIAALLPVYGDDPMLTATVGDYRSKTNFCDADYADLNRASFSAMPYRIYERHY